MSADEAHDFTGKMHELALVVAELKGEVSSLAKQSVSNFDRLVEKIDFVDHRRKNSDINLTRVVDILGDYPRPHVIEQLIEDVESLREWRSKTVGFIAAASLLTSVVTAVLVALITRSLGV